MKNIKILAIVTVLAIGVCSLALAQVHRSDVPGHGAQDHGDPAATVKHLAEVFPQVASFDANKDGKLDEAEKEALGKAIADGKLQLPAHTPPHGAPTGEKMLNHIAEMYAHLAPYDANHDGALDATEQAALKSAIEKGEFAPLREHHGGDAVAMVKHLSEAYPQVAVFDANKDGKLDATEKQSLEQAIANGKVQLPVQIPNGDKPAAEMMLDHIGEMYAHVAKYDVNGDGQLDEKEQAALKSAIEQGEFALHGPHPHEGVQR